MLSRLLLASLHGFMWKRLLVQYRTWRILMGISLGLGFGWYLFSLAVCLVFYVMALNLLFNSSLYCYNI